MHWRFTQNWYAFHRGVAIGLLHSSAVGLYPVPRLQTLITERQAKRMDLLKMLSTQTEMFMQS
jgi:hypothetical protein